MKGNSQGKTGGDGLNIEKLLTPKEAADVLRVEPSWLYQQARRRKRDRIPHVKVGHYVRFREQDLLAYIERRMVKG